MRRPANNLDLKELHFTTLIPLYNPHAPLLCSLNQALGSTFAKTTTKPFTPHGLAAQRAQIPCDGSSLVHPLKQGPSTLGRTDPQELCGGRLSCELGKTEPLPWPVPTTGQEKMSPDFAQVPQGGGRQNWED